MSTLNFLLIAQEREARYIDRTLFPEKYQPKEKGNGSYFVNTDQMSSRADYPPTSNRLEFFIPKIPH